jgi:four helix bundle protein
LSERSDGDRLADAYSFRNLELWDKAQKLATAAITVSRSLPDTVEARELRRQLVRAAASVGANIAEGHGRYTLAAYRNHLSIAKGSAAEADSWLNLLRRLDYIDEATERALHSRCAQLMAGLTRRMQQLEAQAARQGVRLKEEAAAYWTGGDDSEDE